MNLQVGSREVASTSQTDRSRTVEQRISAVPQSPFQSADTESLSASSMSSFLSSLSSEFPPREEAGEEDGSGEQPMIIEPLHQAMEYEQEGEEEDGWRQCVNCGSFMTFVTFEQGVFTNGTASDRPIPILHCTMCEHSDGVDFE